VTRAFIAIFAATLASACAVGPDYERPETAMPGAWTEPMAGGLTPVAPDRAQLAQWWTTLGDPVLTELVTRAVAANLGVQEAEARLREARARRVIARSGFFPTLQANGGVTRNDSADGLRNNTANVGGSSGANNLYSAGLDASWEIDVFGGVRRQVEAAQADIVRSEEDLRDVLVSLAAELALNYVDARSLEARIAIAQANLDAQLETQQIVDWRVQAGISTELELERARTNAAQTRAQLPSLRTSLEQARNNLAVLVGEPPGALTALLATSVPLPATPRAVAVGVPAETLAQRPDVRRAEAELAAQTARVGVATARAYPSLTALGSIGLEALTPGQLLDAGASTWRLAGNTAWVVFDGGAIRGGIDAEDALREQALARFRLAVLSALADVENALVAFAQEQERRDSLSYGSAAAERAVSLAETQYGAGLVDFETVLDSQRSLYVLQEQLAVSEREVTSNLIRLYKALGGGWTPGAGG
jgi:NodT family efflux transporter outer membrane factor (OMF) lipoprotein